MMAPGFHTEKNGYNKQEVDEWIDDLLAENKEITLENQELYQMWVTSLGELEEQYLYCREQGFKDENIAWSKLSTLLEVSRERQELSPSMQHCYQQNEDTNYSKKKPSKIKSICFNLIFYLLLIAIVVGVFIFKDSGSAEAPQDIAGYSVMTVLTRSMQDVLPQNSIIVTKQVDPSTIQVGDDITYLMSNNTTVTHRVINIHDNYAGTGQLGFETQGTMNDKPDVDIVIAANIVGVVIFNSLPIGKGILFIREHIIIISIFAGLIFALSIALKSVFSKKRPEESKQNLHEEEIKQSSHQRKSKKIKLEQLENHNIEKLLST